MRRNVKLLFVIVLSAALSLGALTGCGSSFSATDLVQGNLDLIYLNQYTDAYLDSVGLTKEEANQQYEDGIAVEVEYFCTYFQIELDYCDDTIESQITELYHQIYDHTKFEVGGESKNGDTYLVELTIYPMDIMQNVWALDWSAFSSQMEEQVTSGVLATEEEFETAWAQGIIDMVSAQVSSIDYLDPQTISVQVTKDSDGVYSIDSSDFNRIDSLIIDYSYIN